MRVELPTALSSDFGLVERRRGACGSLGESRSGTMKRSKILMLSGYFPLVAGGSEYQTYLLGRELRAYHDVSYVFRYGNQKQKRQMHGYDLYLVPKHFWRQRLLGRDYVLDYPAIMGLLETVAPDVIYNRGANAYTGIAARYARGRACRLVWHIASDRDVEPRWSNSVRGGVLDHTDTKCIEYGIRNADAIIGQTAHQDGLLWQNYGRQCDLIVGTAPPTPSVDFVKSDSIDVVWVANLKPLKQPEIFLDLVRRLEHRTDARFIMIGRPASGRYKKRLEQAMKGLSHFAYRGERSLEEVNRTLGGAHVCVNTSLYEGFPNTFVQAWLRRVPVVSLHVDPDNVLKTNGLGFHSRSIAGLARDTERLIEDRRLRESMGRQARVYALRHHSLSPNIASIVSLLINVD